MSAEPRRLFALATQPTRGEIAVVDLTAGEEDPVADFEPTQPGYSFLPIGAQPDVVLSTPGSFATFATVLEPGREGIFALPSSCVQARPEGSPLRDLRTWSGCQLPVPPGPMVLLLDPLVDGEIRPACGEEYVPAPSLVGVAPAAQRELCPADLALEEGPLGRRKLAVALPKLSEVWVFDAQHILDAEPGSYDACEPEERLRLDNRVEAQNQELPPELEALRTTCPIQGYGHGPLTTAEAPYPSDFALGDQNHLYISDSAAPLIHVVNAEDPCQLSALEPLQPMSLLDPSAVITTRKVAVSPLTPLGKRFVYAVDSSATNTSGTLIPFDVSPGVSNPTPLVRDRAVYNPAVAPDRITLSGRVADVEFVYRDAPIPTTASTPSGNVDVRVEGIQCEPHPDLYSPNSLEAQHRSEARPGLLRGTFAFAAMLDGQMSVIDVEDLDAKCRRPLAANTSSEENLAGCSEDPLLSDDRFELASVPTVSSELSCHVVTPHWPRGSQVFSNSGGRRQAALRTFPTLSLANGRVVATDQSEEGLNLPKMLGARHVSDQEERLSVGASDYITGIASTQTLDLDPAEATRNSLLLSYQSPREFFEEDFQAVYEGTVRPIDEGSLTTANNGGLGLVEGGVNGRYCRSGIQDMAATRAKGVELGVAENDLDAFARRHADYLQLMGTLKEETDDHWATEEGSQCGAELFEVEPGEAITGYPLCEQFFGPSEIPARERDFRIVEATDSSLVFEPRSFDPTDNSDDRRRRTLEFLSCCFPEPTLYRVRAGHQWVVSGGATGTPHSMTSDFETRRCVEDCSPLSRNLNSRVFEVSCGDNCATDAAGATAIGRARPGIDMACVVDAFDDGIDPDEPGSQCVYQNLTSRFAIYRGQVESNRDMRFQWRMAGEFPLLGSALGLGPGGSTPLSLFRVERPDLFLVPDATTPGLVSYFPRGLTSSAIR